MRSMELILRDFSRGEKRPRREAAHSLPRSVKSKKEWRYIPPRQQYAFMDWFFSKFRGFANFSELSCQSLHVNWIVKKILCRPVVWKPTHRLLLTPKIGGIVVHDVTHPLVRSGSYPLANNEDFCSSAWRVSCFSLVSPDKCWEG